jgi:hypothetical protein
MRRVLLALVVGLLAVAARAQDAASQAAMQASQDAQMAAQQATQTAIQASQQAAQANQQAMQDTQNAANSYSGPSMTNKPKFSVKPGTYAGPQKVFLTDRVPHATIYYTTNGWTPTTHSKRYTGPITVSKTERVQAIAVSPGYTRSQVSVADYVIPGVPATVGNVVVPDGVLRKGTRIPLVFASGVNSSTAKVGDAIQLRLASALEVSGRTLKSDHVEASGVVTAVHRPGMGGQPGEVTFALDAVKADGVVIPVFGEETAEGKDHLDKAMRFVMIPVVNVGALMVHGEEAEIKPDTPVVATVVEDTKLP